MGPSRIAKHEPGCGGTGHLQHIESQAGEKDIGIYRCYNCGQLFKVVQEE